MQRHAWMAGLVLLAACNGKGGSDSGPGGTGATDGTGADGTGACVCDTTDACCDGCDPRGFVVACDDGEADTWAVCDAAAGVCETGGALETYAVDGAVWAHAASAQGGRIAIAGEDEIDGTTGGAAVFSAPGSTDWSSTGVHTGIALSHAGSQVGSCGPNGLVVADFTSGPERLVGPCSGGAVSWSPDDTLLAVATVSGVQVYDTSTWEEAFAVTHERTDEARLWSIAWSPDGTRMATATGQVGFGSPKGEVLLWDGATGEAQGELDCTAMDVAFSPDGSQLAGACWSATRVFDVETGDEQVDITAASPALSVLWSAGGDDLYAGTFQGGVVVYEVATETQVRSYGDDAGAGAIKDLAWDSEGGLVGALWDGPGGLRWVGLAD